MTEALLIDIGSTYTKASLFSLDKISLLASNLAPTTVESDVSIGLKEALKGISNWEKAKYKLACSSAAGGLKIIAIGLTPSLTAEAAKRAALGAGAKVLKTYSSQLTIDDINEIIGFNPDLFLLTGGTDGGNQDNILNNAQILANSTLRQPFIIAGNKQVREKAKNIFKKNQKEAYVIDNVMPQLEKLNIEPAHRKIRQIFLQNIVKARGLDKVNKYIDRIIMPTPVAVLKAAALLADGYKQEKGLGELMVVDIGGATCDVHSVATVKPKNSQVILRGLQEPYLKRTVEGDIGMRYSASTLYQGIAQEDLKKLIMLKDYPAINKQFINKYINKIQKKADYIAVGKEERIIDNFLAYHGLRLAVSRHVGRLKTIYTPEGKIFIQEGKDLSRIKYVLATGGIICNNHNVREILSGILAKKQLDSELLITDKADFLIDKKYILAQCGLLADIQPEISLKLLKKYLKIV